MVLVLSERDVASLLNMTAGVRLVEESFREYAKGQVTLLPRISQNLQGTAGIFRVISAVLPGSGVFGLKTLTGSPGRRDPRETYFALLLFEMGTGALRAVISANYLTGIRTGAATGVAVKHLARKNADILGVLGAGAQARFQVEAVLEVRPITLVKVFARGYDKAEAFAKWVTAEFGVEAQPVCTAEETVRGSGVVVAITTAREPVVHGEWLDEGAHVTSAGANSPIKMELDPTCFVRSRVVTDSQALAIDEAGDLRAALTSGFIRVEDLYADLGDIVSGAKAGRTNDLEVTLFKSIGIAFQDIAVAAFLYDSALATGTGTMLDLDGTSLTERLEPAAVLSEGVGHPCE